MKSGGTGAGTLHTVLAMFEEVPRSVLELSSRAYALSPGTCRPLIIPVLLKTDNLNSPVHGGKSYPHFNFLYALPSPFHAITGSYFALSGNDRAIVERTFGLFELNKSKTPQLTYGSQFRYDEFLVRKGIMSAFLTSAAIAFGILSLTFFAPARWLFKNVIPSSGNGPEES